MRSSRAHLGIDIGGTFTDICFTDGAPGGVQVDKRLTSPNPADTVKAAITELEDAGDLSLSDCDVFTHATTIATNALIERTGPQIGLLTTAGFRDVIEMRDEGRYDLYDAHIAYPEPIPDRRYRSGVPERIDQSGEVVEPLDTEALRRSVDELASAGVEAVGICFLHSYLNDEHERQAKAILREDFPALDVSISAEIAPRLGEYPRMSTTAINASLKPIVDEYIGDIEAYLAAQGFGGNFHVMTSGGGVMPSAAAREVPVRLLESGPTAGALVARYLAERQQTPNVLSFDMGGTTSKGCLIEDFALDRAFTFEAARVHEFRAGSGYPLLIPNVDLIEFSSGGGSIATVDSLGTLTIGPESQGSDPGPACYGRGGEEATITDADVVLGYLRAETLDGSSIDIDVGAAEDVIDRTIAEPMGIDVTEAAAGIFRTANANIANAFKEHAAERGVDVRRSTILAFGGAGPMHAESVADALNIGTVVVPPSAGVLSSFGLLVTPKAVSVTTEVREPLEDVAMVDLEETYERMATDARSVLDLDDEQAADVEAVYKLDMRFEGQGFDEEITYPSDRPFDRSTLHSEFVTHYRRQFDVTPEKPIRVSRVKLELSSAAAASAVELATGEGARTDADPVIDTQTAYYPDVAEHHETTVLDRARLSAGRAVETPCIIEGRGSTTVVGPTSEVAIDDHGNIIIRC